MKTNEHLRIRSDGKICYVHNFFGNIIGWVEGKHWRGIINPRGITKGKKSVIIGE